MEEEPQSKRERLYLEGMKRVHWKKELFHLKEEEKEEEEEEEEVHLWWEWFHLKEERHQS